jgi:hypothetical protein
MVIENTNTGWAFGANLAGQLGEGTNTDRLIPVSFSTVCNVLDIETKNSDAHISLYPNPTQTTITLTSVEPTNFDLFDVNGTILISGRITESVTLPIEHIANGVYFIKTSDGEKMKFIKE